MKRSEINTIIRDADAFIREHRFHLPPFAYWTPADWQAKDADAREIAQHKLGWDITDFGMGDYDRFGLFLFTIRNGNTTNLETCSGKVYAEKLLIVGVDQVTPLHFHWQKVEDIINRGGGDLLVQLYHSTPEEGLDDERAIAVSTDGTVRHVEAGGIIVLTPGESITLPTGLYHKFWARGERVLVGEVSMVNDDDKDNCFLDPIGRFPAIEEDEPPLHLLVNDYPTYYAHA